MAQLGRLYYIVQDSSGTAQASVSVGVYRQGANTAGGGTDTAGPGTVVINVDNPGGVIIGDFISQFRAGAVVTAQTYGVTNVTATSIEVNTGGAISWLDNDRFVPTSVLATIYLEPDGGTVQLPNPIVTDAAGEASTWAFGGFYDLILSGALITTKNIPDVTVVGEINKTNVFTEATAVGFVWDTNRDLTTAGAKIISVRRNGTEKFYIDKDGALGATTFAGGVTISSGGISVTGVSTFGSNITFGGAVAITPGPTSIVGGLTIQTGGLVITAGGLTVTAGAVSLPAGSVTGASLAANAITASPTTQLGGTALVALADNPPAEAVRITVNYAATAGNSGVLVNVSVPYDTLVANGNAAHVKVRLYINSVLKATGVLSNNGNSNTGSNRQGGTVAFSWFEASASTSSVAYEVRDILVDNTGTTNTGNYRGDLTNDGASRAYIQIIEFKK